MAVASCALVVAAALSSCALRDRGAVAWVLAFGLLAWAMCVATVALAGVVVGDLSPTTLFLLSCGWLLVAAVALWRNLRTDLRGRLRRGRAALWQALSWPPAAAAMVVVVVALVIRTVLAIRLPVADLLGWQYHLVFVDVWLQANRIVEVPQNIWTDGWPATGELLTTWLAALTGNDALTGFTGFLPIPIAIVASIGLARTFGASRRTALLGGLLFGMTPVMLALAGTTYVDVAFTASVAAAWWYGLRIVRGERDPSAALLLGVASGLSIGTKGTGFVLVVPMLVAVGVLLVADAVRSAQRQVDGWDRWIGIGALIAPVLLLGASWYAKNLLVHGNPLYPVGIGPYEGLETGSYGAPPKPEALLGLSPIAQVATSWAYDWQLSGYLYNQRPGGFGHAWLLVVALAAAGLVILARRRRWAALGLVVGPAVVALVILTSPWYARYTLFVPAIALPLAAVSLDSLRPVIRMVTGLLLVGLAAISVVLVNAFPNVLLPNSHPTLGGATAYWGAVFDETAPLRALLDAPPHCRRSIYDLPPGARVQVDRDFFAPHAVVGPDLDRILIQPPPNATDARGIVSEMRNRGARWLVTVPGTELDAAASGAGDDLSLRGKVCSAGRLWELQGASGG